MLKIILIIIPIYGVLGLLLTAPLLKFLNYMYIEWDNVTSNCKFDNDIKFINSAILIWPLILVFSIINICVVWLPVKFTYWYKQFKEKINEGEI